MKLNPVIKPVVETFQKVYIQTKMFAENPESAINGMMVMGDAGTGKSHFVKKALKDAGVSKNVQLIKGGTVTAAALYVHLWNNRHNDRICVIDDVDLIGHPEKGKIVPMLLGAVEEGRDRKVTWSTAKRNALMEEYDAPFEFAFNGNVIIITNHVLSDLDAKLKTWSQAVRSRFNYAECIFTHEQKYMYTKHLIENEDMLGDKCMVHKYDDKNGYPQEVIDETVEYIDDNYNNFSDITPRVAVKVADTIYYHSDPEIKRVMLATV